MPAARGSLVWLDVNGDGKQDTGEPGVGGVFVELLDSNNVVMASMTTPNDGSYFFSGLRPGQYRIRFTLPDGYVVTPADQGEDDTVDSDVDPATRLTSLRSLTSAQTDPTWDAGIYRPASIGNRVWVDTDGDATQDKSEPAAPLVRVELLDNNGAVVSNTTTSLAGEYRFSGLAPGTYSVRVVPATLSNGYVLTGRDEATDTTDSDGDRVTGRTAPTILISDEYDPTWFFRSPLKPE